MARYESDCKSLTGWSEPWNTNGTFTLTAVAAARSGYVFRYSAANTYDSFLRLDAADALNFDGVLIVYHAATAQQSAKIVCRASGTADNPATYGGYICGVEYDSSGNRVLALSKMAAGTKTSLTSASVNTQIASGAQRIIVRLNVVETSPVQIRARAWTYGAAEPTTWDIDTTDSSSPITTSGYSGIYASGVESGNHDFDYFGVNTAGSTLLIIPEPPTASAINITSNACTINFQHPPLCELSITSLVPLGVVTQYPDTAAIALAGTAPQWSISFASPTISVALLEYAASFSQTITLAANAPQTLIPDTSGIVAIEIGNVAGEAQASLPTSQAMLDWVVAGQSIGATSYIPQTLGVGTIEIPLVGAV